MAAVPRNGVAYCEDGEADDIKNLILKLARGCADKLIDSTRPTASVLEVFARTYARVLLRCV